MSSHEAELAKKRAQLEDIKRRRQQRLEAKKLKKTGKSQSTGRDDALDDLLGSLDLPKSEGGGRRVVAGGPSHLSTTKNLLWPVSIPPVESVTYSKNVQTDPLPELEQKLPTDDNSELPDDPNQADEQSGSDDVEPENSDDVTAAETDVPVKEEPKIVELTDEQKTEILGQPDFQTFFDKSSRMVERCLNFKYDPTVDYAYNEKEGEDEIAKGDVINFSHEYYEENTTASRTVTAIDWSPKFPELICAAYNANPDTPNEPDGVVLVWNSHMPDRPEYKFECQSAVLSCSFSPFSPHVIVGGTYSGQVVLWDNRSNKRTPVQRSAINSKSHTHPVFCASIVGTQNAHSLVTASSDGKMCSWDLDTLTQPQESLDLQSGNNKALAATTFSFPLSDSNNFVLGTEEGSVFQASRHGSKAGVGHLFEGQDLEGLPGVSHYGPVTGVDFFKANQSGSEFSHLFLTSSTDWTVKLWTFRNASRPLHTFDNASDYVYDVRWSPVNPAVFACVDGTGCLDVWHLNHDIEQPFSRVVVNDGKQALNRLRWSDDGKHIAVGDASGRVTMYTVADRVALPRAKEVERLKKTLQDIEESHATTEETDITAPPVAQ